MERDPKQVRALAARLSELSSSADPEVAEVLTGAAFALSALLERNVALEQTRRSVAAEGRRYRALFDHAPVGCLVTDLNGVILDANEGAAAMFGRRLHLLLRKPLPSLVEPAGKRSFRAALDAAKAHGGTRKVDFRVLGESDTPIDVRATVSIVEHDGGRLYAQWILHDFSDQRRAELEVRALNEQLEGRVAGRTADVEAANARLDALIDQLPVAVLVADAEGRVMELNRHARELLQGAGLDAERPDSYLELQFFTPDGAPYRRHERPLMRALKRGERTTAERVDVHLGDGSVRQLEASVSPLWSPAGEVTGAVALVMDITERERRERAERDFVTNAAHQLRNPLAAIRSAIEVLQAGAKDDPVARERFLGHIERESERLARLARTLLVLARAQASVEQPRREIVRVAPLLYEVAARLRTPDGVAVEVRCGADEATVGNAELLEEALSCLADNAIRHGGAGRVFLDGRSENGALLLEVRDEGPGIPDNVREQILNRFYRGGEGPGFGLGLAIAEQAARAAGGTLEIESAPEGGTSARIRLPAARMLTA